MTKNLSRREALRLGAVAGAGLLVAGCAPVPSGQQVIVEVTRVVEPTPLPTPAPGLARGGQLIHGQVYTWPTLDIHLTSWAGSVNYPLVHNYLVRHELEDAATGKFKIVGELAESWEQQNPTTLAFTLRKGIKFHDGSDFNAEVAKWNLLRMRDHKASFVKSSWQMIDTIDAPDASTLVIKTKNPSGALLPALSGALNGYPGMISQQAVEKMGEDAYGKAPVGTGPFKFKQLIPDDRVILERFDGYWEKGEDGKALPYLDEVVVRYMPDLTVATAELAAGTVHSVHEMPASQFPALSAVKHIQWENWPWVGTLHFIGYMNIQTPPFDKLEVRQALNYAIDREGLAKAIGFGIGTPTGTPWGFHKGQLGYTDEVENYYNYNPDKVKELLTKAGYPNGIDVELLGVLREPDSTVGQFVAASWRKLGINVNLSMMERVPWVERVIQNKGPWQIAFARLSPTSFDPFQRRDNWTCKGAVNPNKVCDPIIEDLMNKGDQEPDQAKRDAIYRELYKHIQEQAYWFSGFTVPYNVVHNVKVGGAKAMFGIPNLRGAWLSKV